MHVFQDLSDIVQRQATMIEVLRDEKNREVKVSRNLFDIFLDKVGEIVMALEVLLK